MANLELYSHTPRLFYMGYGLPFSMVSMTVSMTTVISLLTLVIMLCEHFGWSELNPPKFLNPVSSALSVLEPC